MGVVSLASHAQTLQTVIPPSPTAREFDKFLNYEVSLQNGIPDITIPLYTIRVGKAGIPVELKYHASGIKYGQSSGDVGVGWVLQPGHRVSRTIYGRPDEHFAMASVPSYFATAKERDEFYSQLVHNGGTGLPPVTNYLDGEYDLFTYSLPSGGGGFLIEDRSQKKTMLLSPSNLSIAYGQGSGNTIDYFDLADGNGFSYRFGKSLSSGQSFAENNTPYGSSPIAYSSWPITDVSDGFGSYARFSYAVYQDHEFRPQDRFSIKEGGSHPYLFDPEYTSAFLQNTPNGSITTPDVKRISTITTNNETITFYRNATVFGLLDSLVVRDISGSMVRKVAFSYSLGTFHRFLDAVVVSGGGVAGEKYSFDYYDKDLGMNYSNINRDYWGYYLINGGVGTSFPTFNPQVNYLQGAGTTWNTRYASSDGMTNSDRSRDINGPPPSYFSLRKITYPTGGSREYEYEQGRYGANKSAGIRVKSIRSNDAVTGETLINRYTYGLSVPGENESGSGQVNWDIARSDLYASESLKLRSVGQSTVLAFRQRDYGMNLPGELSVGAYMGSPVNYSHVTQYSTRSNYGGLDPQSTNGKTTYIFSPRQENYVTGFPTNGSYTVVEGNNGASSRSREYHSYFVSSFSNWNRSVLLSKSVYASSGSSFSLLQKEDYDYYSSSTGSVVGLKVRPFATLGSEYYSPNTDYYTAGNTSFFDYSPYDVQAGIKILKSKVVSSYLDGIVLKDSSTYEYNGDFQLAKSERWSSDGKVRSQTSTYPSDLGSVTGGDAFSLGVRKMQESRLLNVPVETVTSEREQGSILEQVTGAELVEFHTEAANPRKLMKLESISPLADFYRVANVSGGLATDTRYKPRIHFGAFTPSGGLSEQQVERGPLTTYLWGYGGLYPIAQISNAGIQQVRAALSDPTGAYIEELRAKTLPSSYDLLLLAGLRNSPLLKDAQVTTYTYKRLIGMESQTDAKGMATYYDYDQLGRLITIKDRNGDIVKSYCYNLAGTTTDCGGGGSTTPIGTGMIESFVGYSLYSDDLCQLGQPGTPPHMIMDIYGSVTLGEPVLIGQPNPVFTVDPGGTTIVPDGYYTTYQNNPENGYLIYQLQNGVVVYSFWCYEFRR